MENVLRHRHRFGASSLPATEERCADQDAGTVLLPNMQSQANPNENTEQTGLHKGTLVRQQFNSFRFFSYMLFESLDCAQKGTHAGILIGNLRTQITRYLRMHLRGVRPLFLELEDHSVHEGTYRAQPFLDFFAGLLQVPGLGLQDSAPL